MPQDRPGHLPSIILHGHSIAGLEPIDIRRIRDAGPPRPERTYPHVRLVGNYNLGCIDTQTLDYNTSPQRRPIAWPGKRSAAASTSSPITMSTGSLWPANSPSPPQVVTQHQGTPTGSEEVSP